MMDKDRILILDGAMGTAIQRYGLGGNSEALNLSHPEVIAAIHREYIEAGADIIETNSFSANSISQLEYGCQSQAAEMAFRAARIAREAADSAPRKVLVAGSMGPTSKSLTLPSDANDPSIRAWSFDGMEAAYFEQAKALIEGGVDFLLLETCFDALNVKAAIHAIERASDELRLTDRAADELRLKDGKFPIAVSVSVSDRSGRTLTGQTLRAFYTSIRHCKPIAFGINCSLGAEEMQPLVAELSSFVECPLICYPNAGLPNELGGYDQSAEEMAVHIRKMAEDGLLNIVGGCCGTTDRHIRAIAEAVKGLAPRRVPARREGLELSGLENICIDRERFNFTNVGERTNVAGSRKFARLIAEGNYAEGIEIAAKQIEDGASLIDINMDDAMLDSAVEMEKFVRCIAAEPAVAKAALMIDSSHWDTVLAGLKNAQGKCVVNSISLKEGENAFLEKAREILRLGAAVVVMAFDEEGQATDYTRKISICKRAWDLLRDIGFDASDIIFDVNVLSVGTGEASDRRYGIDFIEAVRWIKSNLPGALTSGGISNLSFAFRGNNPVREAMHSVFLYHAVKAGLDMGIVNPSMLRVYDDIEPQLRQACEDVILDSDAEAAERLLELASGTLQAAGPVSGKSASAETKLSLSQMLVKGRSEGLREEVLAELERLGEAGKVISGPLMEGMEQVGILFGEGKMFLPQVMKSARVMKEAVAVLQPYLDAAAENGSDAAGDGESAGSGKGRDCIVIATVKGDVHDIGKNITATVLRCNGFRVVDLGVMVDNESILETAAREKAAIVAVSGLITPSLKVMEDLCRLMSARGLRTPLFIGGATTSALHTAVKLAPLYDRVFYGADASASAVMAKRYILDSEAFIATEHAAQEELRRIHAQGRGESRKDIFQTLDSEGYMPYEELKGRDIEVCEVPLDAVRPFIDWNTFYAIWRIKADERQSEAALQIRREAEEMLGRLRCHIRLGCHFIRDGVGCWAGAVHPLHIACDCPACKSADFGIEDSLRLTLADAISGYIASRLAIPEPYKVVLPGIGYPSCPDHSLKKSVLESIPGSEEIGIRLSENYAMSPDASVCGYVVVHKEARYI